MRSPSRENGNKSYDFFQKIRTGFVLYNNGFCPWAWKLLTARSQPDRVLRKRRSSKSLRTFPQQHFPSGLRGSQTGFPLHKKRGNRTKPETGSFRFLSDNGRIMDLDVLLRQRLFLAIVVPAVGLKVKLPVSETDSVGTIPEDVVMDNDIPD